ncbi:MAG: response regulator transcription factor, partial [Tritonibacter mobilis]|nr:response regulator transcription factor [Tritonibacter mobilis]
SVSPGQDIAFGTLRIDVQSRRLLDAEGEEIPLTNAEYRLLEYFAKNPDRVIPRPELLEELGSDMQRYVDRTIDVLILRLRRKIEKVPSKPVHLQTRRAQGYIFRLAAT